MCGFLLSVCVERQNIVCHVLSRAFNPPPAHTMADKLDMALDDMIPKKSGRGKGGGGKMDASAGRGAGKQARAALSAPYQKPIKGKGKGGGMTLASMTQTAVAAEMTSTAQPTFGLTTGTAIKVATAALAELAFAFEHLTAELWLRQRPKANQGGRRCRKPAAV